MEPNTVTDADYEKFKDLLRFFYAQYRYNCEAGGAGGVGKVPHPDANTSIYDLKEHLKTFDIEELQSEPMQIGDMVFVVVFSGTRGQMGSNPNTYISLCDTAVGLYLNQNYTQGRKGAKTDKPFSDFFTWDDPNVDPKKLYVGEREKPVPQVTTDTAPTSSPISAWGRTTQQPTNSKTCTPNCKG